jgi:TatD DNase family protein
VSIPRYFDVHTHTQFVAFEGDHDAVIKRALEGGVWIINVGTQHDTSQAAVTTAERFEDGVFATVGLHPIHTEKSHHDPQELGADQKFTSRGEQFDQGAYKKLAEHPSVVAIGECGLDYYRLGDETKKRQKEVFLKQILLAHETEKPLMVHCRDAFDDLIDLLKAERTHLIEEGDPGVIHFFSGTIEHAKALLDLGFSFSFGGVTTFTHDYDALVRYIPLENILSETDAPYVTPIPFRGKRNEPLYVQEVAKRVAEIREDSIVEVKSALVQNALRVFRIPHVGCSD